MRWEIGEKRFTADNARIVGEPHSPSESRPTGRAAMFAPIGNRYDTVKAGFRSPYGVVVLPVVVRLVPVPLLVLLSSWRLRNKAEIKADDKLVVVVFRPSSKVVRTAGSQPLNSKADPPMAIAIAVRTKRVRTLRVAILVLLQCFAGKPIELPCVRSSSFAVVLPDPSTRINVTGLAVVPLIRSLYPSVRERLRFSTSDIFAPRGCRIKRTTLIAVLREASGGGRSHGVTNRGHR